MCMWNSVRQFYSSIQWTRTSRAFKKYKQNLCERCLKKGYIVPATQVHHKIRLNANNVNDTKISLSYDNLEALCDNCHEREHEQDAQQRYSKRKNYKSSKRYKVDKLTGKVIANTSPMDDGL